MALDDAVAAFSIVRPDVGTRPRRTWCRPVRTVAGVRIPLRSDGLVRRHPNFQIYHGDRRLLKRRAPGDD